VDPYPTLAGHTARPPLHPAGALPPLHEKYRKRSGPYRSAVMLQTWTPLPSSVVFSSSTPSRSDSRLLSPDISSRSCQTSPAPARDVVAGKNPVVSDKRVVMCLWMIALSLGPSHQLGKRIVENGDACGHRPGSQKKCLVAVDQPGGSPHPACPFGHCTVQIDQTVTTRLVAGGHRIPGIDIDPPGAGRHRRPGPDPV